MEPLAAPGNMGGREHRLLLRLGRLLGDQGLLLLGCGLGLVSSCLLPGDGAGIGVVAHDALPDPGKDFLFVLFPVQGGVRHSSFHGNSSFSVFPSYALPAHSVRPDSLSRKFFPAVPPKSLDRRAFAH